MKIVREKKEYTRMNINHNIIYWNVHFIQIKK